MSARTLGINGFGRIGKLSLWYHLGGDDFDTMVVNLGREVGSSLEALLEYATKDSTYGPVHRYLHGRAGRAEIEVVDEGRGVVRLHGKEVRFLREKRDPREIPWREHDVQLVVDATGKFADPTKAADDPKGALRGHLESGARVVVVSAPFKGVSTGLPADAAVLINGINQFEFDPGRHRVVSAASCTTTALAHMVRPLLDRDATRHILTASMSTVHATTNSQMVLDAVPKAGATDLRKTRSVFNNIILTSTGAARALEMVMPEIGRIGFMADSVRVPLTTGSLIILNLTFQSEMTVDGRPSLDRQRLNEIYRAAAEGEARDLVVYSEQQNVSADIVGQDAAVVIEAAETHTRTGFIHLQLPVDLGAAAGAPAGATAAAGAGGSDGGDAGDRLAAGMGTSGEVDRQAMGIPDEAERLPNGGTGGGTAETGEGGAGTPGRDQAVASHSAYGEDSGSDLDLEGRGPLPGAMKAAYPGLREVRVPVTHAKIFGWYDNELGSYTGRLGQLTAQIAADL
jgi:glyceraldehyde 3-phosphate dehydrogenase